MMPTGRWPRSSPARRSPRTSAACCATYAWRTSPGQRPGRAALGHAARPVSQRAAPPRHRDARGGQRVSARLHHGFNRRFARAPTRLAPCGVGHYRRVVARDNTVRLGVRWLRPPPGPRGRSYAGSRVELRELLDGRLVTLHEGVVLASHGPDARDFVLKPRRAPGADRRPRPHRPAPPAAPRRLSPAATRRTPYRPPRAAGSPLDASLGCHHAHKASPRTSSAGHDLFT
jgi:hypothetical protein